MSSDEFRRLINLVEGIDWKGNADGSSDAANTDHTYDEAVDYMKKKYKFIKKFTVTRAEPGFRINQGEDGDVDFGLIDKINAHMDSVDSTVDYLELKKNEYMSGSDQVSSSLGYSWFTMENDNIGLQYYQDRGMGSDQITIAANDKQSLLGLIDMLVEFNVIKDPKKSTKRKDNADKRNSALEKKGIKVGTRITGKRIDNGELLWSGVVDSITNAGAVKIKIDKVHPDTQTLSVGDIKTMKPGSIAKDMITNESTNYSNILDLVEDEITLSEGTDFHEEFGYLGYPVEEGLFEAEYQGRKVTLNKPIRSSNGPKKFHVYVKDGDKVKKVNFGDPNMEIKADNPKRRKSFRARHNCDNPGPKTKARYWSCKKW
jgi:hypothetical protein